MYSYTILALASLATAAVVPGGSQYYPDMEHRNGTVTTTRVVNAYTTYCPEPTTFELGGKTYEVAEPTTLTITECPCTIVEVSPFRNAFRGSTVLTCMIALLHLRSRPYWHRCSHSSRSLAPQP